ncbi:hypothetical protein CkP1_0133 [Citrobacter phage CkP1]|nr:hypothetical protein CkP1_0133 [Citrobacter phage CkP1]
MSVAVFVKSESGDYYLYSFGDNESEEQIKEQLEDNLSYFSPICEWMVSTSDDTSPSVETRMTEFMNELFDRSWK